MKVIGVTGSLGTGKTTVAKMFQALGARVLDADAIVRVLQTGSGVIVKEIIAVFGREVVSEKGTIDRRKLAGAVFHNTAARRRLERILHPRVKKELARQVRSLKAEKAVAAVVWDVPLLIEAGMARDVDAVVVVKANRELQLQRSARRLKISRADGLKRIQAQKPIQEKLKRADYIIDNRGTLAATRRQVKAVWQEVLSDNNRKGF